MEERERTKMSGLYSEKLQGREPAQALDWKLQEGTEGCWENLEAMSTLVGQIGTSASCHRPETQQTRS